MNIPEKIVISGMEYKVGLSNDVLFCDNLRAYGHIDFDKKEILIDKTLRENQGHIQTLIHEILHGIVYDREISFLQDDEETIINQLAKGLYQIIIDNPNMFK